MSQSIKQEHAEVLQDVCSDTSSLEQTKAICSRDTVVMDKNGNLLPVECVTKGENFMRVRKELVLGISENWGQHSLSEANELIDSIPSDCDTRTKIVKFINKQLQ